jgi:hydrogenase-4 membrane subunit HyfE
MSFLQEDVLQAEEVRTSMIAENAADAVYLATVEQQGRGYWDQIVTYVIISLAFAARTMLLKQMSFFTLLAICMGIFQLLVGIKAYVSMLMATRTQQYPVHGRSSIELTNQVLTLLLAMFTYLLVYVVMQRVDGGIGDGQFTLRSMVMPGVIFVMFYILWHINTMRHKPMPT